MRIEYLMGLVLKDGRTSRLSVGIQTFLILGISLLASCVSCRAQAAPPDENLIDSNGANLTAVVSPTFTSQPVTADPTASYPSPSGTTSADDEWHLAVSPYLWFPGIHGTVSGPHGRGLGFRASPGDMLSHFRFGLMGAVEANRKRLVLTGDLVWVRLRDDKSVPFPVLGASSATMKATEFFLTPKIGLRLINQKKFKVIALTGFRYWHLGESLSFNPSLLGLNFSGSQNFVDPLVGGRIEAFLAPKVVVNILGDVGGWGTGSQLEYQWAGMLGYKIRPRWTLQAGYRYLYIDKHSDNGLIFNATTAGVVFGVTIDLK